MNLLLAQMGESSSFGSGCFGWLASMVLLAAAGGFYALTKQQKNKAPALLLGRAAQSMTTRVGRFACVAVLVGLFVVSFFLPVYFGIFGWEAFLAPVLFDFAGPQIYFPASPALVIFGWLPNLLFPLGVVLLLLRRNGSAMAVGFLASLVACLWLWHPPRGLGLGYFVWLASMVLLAAAGGCYALLKVQSNKTLALVVAGRRVLAFDNDKTTLEEWALALFLGGRRILGSMSRRHWQLLSMAAIVGVFALSLLLPATRTEWEGFRFAGRHGDYALGWEACLSSAQYAFTVIRGSGTWPGLEGLLFSLPNMLFAVGVISLALRYHRVAFVMGFLASLLCCLGLLIFRPHVYSGYFVWLASMVLLAVTPARFAFMTRHRAGVGTSAPLPLGALPDPGALALFNQPQSKAQQPTDVHSGVPRASGPSSIQPPSSRSS
jgi:hypothetical protein